jgi:putative DNA primase/helicase
MSTRITTIPDDPFDFAEYLARTDPAKRKERDSSQRFELTDAGNGQRLAKRHGADLRYVPEWGWVVWDGRRWRKDELAARSRAVESARHIHAEAANESDDNKRRAITRWAERSQQAQRIGAALWLAEPDHAAHPEQFDKDTFLLCVRNGVIDLRSGQLRDHRREDYMTRAIDADYKPGTPCPRWLAFLERVQPSPCVRAFLQRWLGYCLTGSTAAQCFVVNYGTGANGKTTLATAMLNLLGEYGTQADFATFLQRREPGIRNDLAGLCGSRVVMACEGPEGAKLDTATIKGITGSDTVTARFLHKEYFSFAPTFKLMLATNHMPAIRDTSNAMWRRVLLVPWTVTIPESERRPIEQILGELRAEASGMLEWCIAGCLQWQRDGLIPPDEVQRATADYKEDQDDIGRWIGDRCIIAPHAKTPAADLYRDYVNWCESDGNPTMSQRALGNRLHERGLATDRDRNKRFWTGIGLASVTHDACDTSLDVTDIHARAIGVTPKNASHASQASQVCPRCDGEGCRWCA